MKINSNSNSYNNHYSLSIRFTSDGFSLYVWDKSHSLISSYNTSINLFDKTETEIFDILSQQQELKLDFVSIRFIVEAPTYSTIPLSMLNAELGTQALKLKYAELAKPDLVLHNKLLAWDAAIVFSCNAAFYRAIKEVLPQLEIEHHIYSFMSNNIALGKQTGIFVRFRKDTFDLILIVDGKLTLINSYNAKEPEDFLYYLLQVTETYKLDSKTVEVTIYKAENKAKHIQLINKYLNNCKTETEL